MANGQKRRGSHGDRRLEGLPATQLSSIPDPVPRKIFPMKQARNKRGFTLLEILVAITILATGLLGVAGLNLGIMKGNLVSNRVTTATALAQDKMENINRMDYSQVTEANIPQEGYNGGIQDYPLYKRDTVITLDTPSPGMKTVQVTVSWAADDASVSIETFLVE